LNRVIGPKQSGEVEHRHSKRFADEVACLVDGDVVRRRAVTVQDKDPFEAVLCDLSAKIGHERSERRLSDGVSAGMDRHVAQLVRSALAIVHCGHHDKVPIWQRSTHTRCSSVRFVRDTDRVGTNR
jgi:hypothetical protein